jgi:hypothetical protein
MTARPSKQKIKTTADAKRLRNELLSEIGNLRITFQEIVSRFQADVESKMVWCINNLSSEDDVHPELKNEKMIKTLLKDLADLRLKPRKGRLKDLRKIEKTIDAISTRFLE